MIRRTNSATFSQIICSRIHEHYTLSVKARQARFCPYCDWNLDSRDEHHGTLLGVHSGMASSDPTFCFVKIFLIGAFNFPREVFVFFLFCKETKYSCNNVQCLYLYEP